MDKDRGGTFHDLGRIKTQLLKEILLVWLCTNVCCVDPPSDTSVDPVLVHAAFRLI